MRHGETLYQSRAAEGALGNGELTERGREQVASIALLFGTYRLTVCMQVLCLVHRQRRQGASAKEKGLDVLVSNDIREITPEEAVVSKLSPADTLREVQRFFKESAISWDEPYLGGESFRQVQNAASGFSIL